MYKSVLFLTIIVFLQFSQASVNNICREVFAEVSRSQLKRTLKILRNKKSRENIMEKVWLAEEGKISTEGVLSREALEEYLANAKIISMEALVQVGVDAFKRPLKANEFEGEGVGKLYMITLEGGVKAIYRTDHKDNGVQHEVGAYLVDKLLNMNFVPTTVFRTIDGKQGSIQIYIDNAQTLTQKSFRWRFWPFLKKFDPDKYVRNPKMVLLDLFIGNRDRNHGNVLMINKSNREVGIDHNQPGRIFNWENIEMGELKNEVMDSPFEYYPGKRSMKAIESVNSKHELLSQIEQVLGQDKISNVLFLVNRYMSAYRLAVKYKH